LEPDAHPQDRVAVYRQIGVSRPPLEVVDLPTPEEVFAVKRIGLEEMVLFVLGPSMIALGTSMGSGEWLLGPLVVGKYGFTGIGWVILVSIVLQVFYNVELARFTLATGETPVLAFGRIPPGSVLWIPLALFALALSFLVGGWAVNAGASLFVLFMGRPYLPEELETVRILGIVLLALSFIFVLFGRKIERSLEIVFGVTISFIFIGLTLVTLAVVPLSYWGHALASLVTVAAPPRGTDVTLLGALVGYAAMASGLNFLIIGAYRDKGYGMGHKVGFIGGIVGGMKETLLPVGKTFPENEKNAALWRRWFRILLIDQWGVYFTGCIVGMMAPCILVGYLSSMPGEPIPTQETIPVYAALRLGQEYGPVLFGWALLTGFAMLNNTQMGILDSLTRCVTDSSFGISAAVRKKVGNDPRWLYYLTRVALVVVMSILIHLAPPMQLIKMSANMASLASMIFPLAMIYLNRQLPKPARIQWWSYLVLLANVFFFGFFFINFVAMQMTGTALIRF
jgi:hypothetical protein